MVGLKKIRKLQRYWAFAHALCAVALVLTPCLSNSASLDANSISSANPPSAAELFKRFKPAVVKIIIKQESIPVTVGAGFFVSETGHLITNHHVMKNVISQPGFTAEFLMSNGTIIKEFEVANCGDERNIDLCLLRLNVAPTSFFNSEIRQASPGETIFVIGHPRGFDFSISNGIISGVRKSPQRIDEVQISAAISPGNSGGPIFNSHGQLIGIVTKFLADSQNLNFGILTTEIAKYRKNNKRFHTLHRADQIISQRTRARMRQLARSELKPALSRALRAQSLNGLEGVKEVTFDFGDRVLKTYLPTHLETCTKSSKQPDILIHTCFAAGDVAVFSVQRFTLETPNGLLEMNNKDLLSPKPLGIINSMKQDGTWTEYEKKINPKHLRRLFSSPSKAHCQKLLPNKYPNAAFSEAPACHFTVKNDEEPGAESINVWLEDGRYLYSFAIWLSEDALAEYYRQVPTLAILASRSVPKDRKEIIASSLKRK